MSFHSEDVPYSELHVVYFLTFVKHVSAIRGKGPNILEK